MNFVLLSGRLCYGDCLYIAILSILALISVNMYFSSLDYPQMEKINFGDFD